MTVADLVGTRLRPSVLVIERGAVQSFAAAVKDDHPAYTSVTAAAELGFGDIPVPPTFLFALPQFGSFAELQPAAPEGALTLAELLVALRDDRSGMVLHGTQEFTYADAVWVGDVLDVEGYVESAETKPGTADKPGMSVLVVRTDYRRQGADRIVATTRSTFLFRPKA